MVWEFNEEKFTNDIKPEEEEEKKKSKRKVTYVQKVKVILTLVW